MNVGIAGVSVCAPGLPDWPTAREVLRGAIAFDTGNVRDPAPAALPANERRRLPAAARLAIGLGLEALQEAGADPATTATVFASCGSDGMVTHQICEALAANPVVVSPTRFHNSVHNAPTGYWGIALQTRAPSTSLCAFEDSFAAGLLEAAVQAVVERTPVLLMVCDLPYPAPLDSLWNVAAPFGVALVLDPEPAHGMGLSIDVTADEPQGAWPAQVPETLSAQPAAASLRVLALLAGVGSSEVVLRCQAGTALRVARLSR